MAEADYEVVIEVRIRTPADSAQPCVQSAQVFNQPVTLAGPPEPSSPSE